MPDAQLWAVIPEFPEYEVSNWGLVFSLRRSVVLRNSPNNYGDLKVSLFNDDGRFTRSVSTLVARAFVPPLDVLSDTVIHLDGRKSNVFANNLMWRPRWYAWKYARQMHTSQPNHYYNLPVYESVTDRVYESIVEAGQVLGLLYDDIWKSTYGVSGRYPGTFGFEVVKRV